MFLFLKMKFLLMKAKLKIKKVIAAEKKNERKDLERKKRKKEKPHWKKRCKEKEAADEDLQRRGAQRAERAGAKPEKNPDKTRIEPKSKRINTVFAFGPKIIQKIF